MKRTDYISRLLGVVGSPYGWSQWGPTAFDCSGLVSYGLMLSVKYNTVGLATLFRNNPIARAQAAPGTLYFYGDKGKPNHVMTVLRHWDNGGITLIGARGGDALVTTLDAARDKKAFVDVCFGDYWLDKFMFALDPFNGAA